MAGNQSVYTFVASRRVGSGEVDARQIRALTKDEFKDIDLAIQSVEAHLTGFDAYIWRVLEDLESTTDKVRAEFGANGSSFSAGSLVSELELRLINVCSVLKMYAEHVIVLIGQMYGKKSDELGHVKRLLSHLYDSSLPYRVCNHLRNALVHGSPNELLGTNLRASLGDSGETVTTVQVFLSREGFRKHAQNAKVRDEVVALPDELELISITTDAAKRVTALHADILDLLSPRLIPAVELLAGLFEEAREVLLEDEWIGFLELAETSPGQRQIRPLMLPERVSRFIGEYIAERAAD
ncbi:hypothetical protein IRJ34_15245 [Paenarthrobacter sp. GOM3]|uniref:hypothetical protein n=1 Tax=Paenarthrobacter sp. GOM3 TaxID=2782567 RepID=UPI001BA8EBCC|nr:hypothetical protein [Paenarthrobacter sp. GOM3]WOH17690.1 hypothetical protein IRJ34_15245 [Paenarthrobacter sp. GOM3]